jgi:hypothetical protein
MLASSENDGGTAVEAVLCVREASGGWLRRDVDGKGDVGGGSLRMFRKTCMLAYGCGRVYEG